MLAGVGLTVTALAAAPQLAGPTMTAAVAFLGLSVAFDRRTEIAADLFDVDLTRDLDAAVELMRFYVDALLIRPDGCIAWALPTGQDLDAATLCVRWPPGSVNRPERGSNRCLSFAR